MWSTHWCMQASHSLRWHHQYKMTPVISGLSCLYFCTVAGSGEVASIFISVPSHCFTSRYTPAVTQTCSNMSLWTSVTSQPLCAALSPSSSLFCLTLCVFVFSLTVLNAAFIKLNCLCHYCIKSTSTWLREEEAAKPYGLKEYFWKRDTKCWYCVT